MTTSGNSDDTDRTPASIDLDDVYERLGLPDEIINSLLADFADLYGNFAAEVQEATDHGDLALVRERAHALRGASSSLGMSEIANCAGRLEKEAASERAGPVQEEIKSLSTAIDEAVAAIKSLIA